MRYSFEFKVKCVDLYHQGIWPDTPDGVSKTRFHYAIREWVRLERLHGLDALRCKAFHKEWSPEEKYELVAKVISGTPRKKVAIDAAISPGLLYRWVQKYKEPIQQRSLYVIDLVIYKTQKTRENGITIPDKYPGRNLRI